MCFMCTLVCAVSVVLMPVWERLDEVRTRSKTSCGIPLSCEREREKENKRKNDKKPES